MAPDRIQFVRFYPLELADQAGFRLLLTCLCGRSRWVGFPYGEDGDRALDFKELTRNRGARFEDDRRRSDANGEPSALKDNAPRDVAPGLTLVFEAESIRYSLP